MQEVDRLARFEELVERLDPWLEARAFEADAAIVTQGEEQEGMLLVTEGRAIAREGDSGARMAELGPGDALAAEAAFVPYVPQVSVVAATPCRTALMTPAARRALERDDLALAVELDRYLIETISAH